MFYFRQHDKLDYMFSIEGEDSKLVWLQPAGGSTATVADCTKTVEEICRTSETIYKMISLFQKHRESLGVGDEDELDSQCEFEDKFCGLICEHMGHQIIPDQCGKPEHDFCSRCRKLRTEIDAYIDSNVLSRLPSEQRY